MSVVLTDKIFVDPNDEVLFVIDAVNSKERDKVIIIIPENALILSSFITLKILYREIIRSKKIVIVVTEDSFGLNIAQKAGFVAVQKVSQITEELWDIAFSKKIKAQDFLRNKNKNIGTPSEDPNLKETQDRSFVSLPTEKTEELPQEITKQVKDEQEVSDTNKFKVLPKKIININGIEVMVGGDIALLSNSAEHDKIEKEYVDRNFMNKQETDKVSSGKFTGRDFTKIVKKENFWTRLKKGRRPNRAAILDPDALFNKRQQRQKILSRIGIILVVVLGGVFTAWFLIDNYSSVDIHATVKPEGVKELAPVQITGSIFETQLNLEEKIIPVVEYTVENVSASRTGDATGQGTRGTKARGLVTIYNTYTEPDPQPISLPAGTKITNIGSNLVFVLLSDLVLDAPVKDGSGIYNTPLIEDIEVEAFEIGEKYNLLGEGASNNFLVDGYESSKIRVTKFTPFAGGTSESFVSVSKENIDNLKKTFYEDLKKQAESRIVNLIPQGFTLLEGSILISDEKIESSPKESEEAPDKTFNLNLSLKARGYAVRTDYINSMARSLLLLTKSDKDNIDIEEIKEANITFVSEADNKILISLASKGSFKNIVDKDMLKNSIVNKSFEEAKAILKGNPDLSDVRIIYTPFFVPQFLQRIPWSVNRITVTLN